MSRAPAGSTTETGVPGQEVGGNSAPNGLPVSLEQRVSGAPQAMKTAEKQLAVLQQQIRGHERDLAALNGELSQQRDDSGKRSGAGISTSPNRARAPISLAGPAP